MGVKCRISLCSGICGLLERRRDTKEEDFKKDIAKAATKLMNHRNRKVSGGASNQELPTSTFSQTRIGPLLARACARLQISAEVVPPAVHLTEMVYHFGYGKSTDPYVTAAAALLIIAWLSDVEHKPWFGEVAAATRVSVGAVKSSYEKIKPELGKGKKDGIGTPGLLPQDFQIRLRGGLEALPPPNAVNPCDMVVKR